MLAWYRWQRFVHQFLRDFVRGLKSVRVYPVLAQGEAAQMRKVAIIIAVLFMAKIGYEQIIYRSATYDVIVGTYAQRAIKACSKTAENPKLAETMWAQPSSVKLVIGKSDLDVYFWQVNHLMWRARYKNPYLFITARNEPNYMLCEYDIMRQSAFVQQM